MAKTKSQSGTEVRTDTRTQSVAGLPKNRSAESHRTNGSDHSYRLSYDEIKFEIDPETVPDPAESSGRFEIIGQPRALQALRMAIEMQAKGYNVFVTGLAGTGKKTAVTKLLDDYRDDTSRIRDIVYVYNFASPDEPRVLYFPPGKARQFRDKLRGVINDLRRTLEFVFHDTRYAEQRDRIIQDVEGRESRSITEFETRIDKEGFRIVQDDDRQKADIAPILNGEPASFHELQQQVVQGSIEAERIDTLRTRYYQLIDEMNRLFQELRIRRADSESRLQNLRQEAMRPRIRQAFDEIRSDFTGEALSRYLEELERDLLENLDILSLDSTEKDDSNRRYEYSRRYEINIVVDHSGTRNMPVVFESNPDYSKLFGTIEPSGEDEPYGPGHMNLRAGSLLRASGGFLILRAEDLLPQEESWNSLKRVLQDGVSEIRIAPGPHSVPLGLKPEPVEVRIKVVVMGNEHIYDILYSVDDEFGKLFKIPSEFDSVMVRDDETTRRYVQFLQMICNEEQLLTPDRDGVAAILEYSVRLSEFRNRFSTRFSMIADILRESDYWARRESRSRIDRDSVSRAIQERTFLYNLPEEKIDEQILSGELLVSVTGREVGRINGLAIIDRGYYAFARPMLITARTAVGSDGIINIERESGLSGEIHDKGMYILEGYLQSKYAREFPLSVRGSICFEQSYVEVDGDSASSGEIYVLLSAIGDVPLRQDVAVTGSVNQMGEIQPVGGINEKIEGFYHICRKIGLSGTQGVIIPRQNIANLTLVPEVQEAIGNGRFHVWAVETIDEGIEILTGIESGMRTQKGPYKTGTVNGIVEKRLREMALQLKDFGGGH